MFALLIPLTIYWIVSGIALGYLVSFFLEIDHNADAHSHELNAVAFYKGAA